MNSFLTLIGGAFGVLALIAMSAVWRGYVLAVLWGWFVVPVFGLPTLSIVAAIGVSLVVGYLTHQISNRKSEQEGWSGFVESACQAALYPLLALAIGWAVHQFQ